MSSRSIKLAASVVAVVGLMLGGAPLALAAGGGHSSLPHSKADAQQHNRERVQICHTIKQNNRPLKICHLEWRSTQGKAN